MREQGAAGFLGCGISFPPRVDAVTGRMRMCSQEEDIEEAVRIILFTGKGERVMRPDFGCGIRKYAFSAMSMIDQKGMEEEIRTALVRYEPRITDVEIQVDCGRIHEGAAQIHIGYVVRATNNPYNLVFPYYINEGV
ncbi:MAG: GPW/gp25 family protein [Lachnospiraceae bacterium]|nr:GPW/gp25 family protein [Lachnospiraceae bacterium]